MVRAVGIEPTLLSEPDFEWGAPSIRYCFIVVFGERSSTCVRFCVSFALRSGSNGRIRLETLSALIFPGWAPVLTLRRLLQANLAYQFSFEPVPPRLAWTVQRANLCRGILNAQRRKARGCSAFQARNTMRSHPCGTHSPCVPALRQATQAHRSCRGSSADAVTL